MKNIKIINLEQLKNLPSVEWLIEGTIPLQGTCEIVGATGVGKSFLALDVACSISSGTDWFGKTTKKGPVIYIVGEGLRGIYQRIAAWQNGRDTEAGEVYFVTHPVQMAQEEEVTALIEAIKQQCEKPVLIVVDTLERLTKPEK